MKTKPNSKSLWKTYGRPHHARGRKRGVALITALILLSVAMLLGLSIMLTTSSDVFISGAMRNSKTAYYAADAGISLTRTALLTALKNRTPSNLASDATSILPSNIGSLVQGDALSTVGNGSTQTFSSDSTHGDLASTYSIDTSNSSFALSPGYPQISINNGIRSESYKFAYQVTSNGAARGQAASTAVESGTVYYNLEVLPSSRSTYAFSFAGYGLFVDQYTGYPPLLRGWITGRAHTNGEWGFASGSPGYGFTDRVTSVNQNAKYVFGSSVYDSNSDSLTKFGQTIAPQFQGGFTRGAASVPLPQDTTNQLRAVLDGIGYDPNNPLVLQPAPTQVQMSATLVGLSGAYNSPGTGVYIPVTTVNSYSGPIYTYSGGGIYVGGNVDDLTLDGSQPGLQIYSIRQGSTTTQVTLDLVHQSTTLTVVGGATHTYPGLPTNVYPVNPSRNPSIQPLTSVSFYVNGSINSMHGPGNGQPAIQDRAAMTITATSNITISGDLTYRTRPITVVPGESQPGVPANSPAGTLIPGNDNGQALGIFTATGNIMLDVSGIPSGNIEIDASLATLSNGGTGGVTVAPGSPYANYILILGGRIQNQLMVLGNWNTVRNVLFDRRYANSAYAPPFFPATSAQFALTTVWDRVSASRPIAVPTSYVVPSRLVAAANAGH